MMFLALWPGAKLVLDKLQVTPQSSKVQHIHHAFHAVIRTIVCEVWFHSTEEKRGNLMVPAHSWCANINLVLVVTAQPELIELLEQLIDVSHLTLTVVQVLVYEGCSIIPFRWHTSIDKPFEVGSTHGLPTRWQQQAMNSIQGDAFLLQAWDAVKEMFTHLLQGDTQACAGISSSSWLSTERVKA